MSQLALLAESPGEGRGWVVCDGGTEAHYFENATNYRTLCGDAKTRSVPFDVAKQEHLGKVELCEHCKDALMGRPRRIA